MGNVRLLLKLLPEWDSLWSSGQLLSSFFSCLLCHLTRQRWGMRQKERGNGMGQGQEKGNSNYVAKSGRA